MREARAYNRSILFMVAMPYLLLASMGGLFYWSYRTGKKRAELLEAAEQAKPALEHV